MNRYKALEHYNIINFKKDEHTPDKIVSAEDACDRLNDLERQLEEARELIKDAVTQLSYYSACGGTQATEFLDRNKDLIEQLKE